MATVRETVQDDWIGAAGGSEAVGFTKDWPLVDNPKFVFSAMATYLLLIQVGKAYMRDRKPLQIRKIMIVHNFTLVALSTYVFTTFFRTTILRKDFNPGTFICEMPDERLPGHRMHALAMWWFYISKMIDLMDTGYLIMKKRPVSVLHAYHHTTVLFLGWVLIRYLPSGASAFGPMMNSFVHMVMYTYYGLSAIGPHMQKYLWWKRYLTRLQMTQFIVIFVYTYIPLVLYAGTEGCHYPKQWIILQCFYSVSLFVLFANFYYQTYIKKAVKKDGVTTMSNGHIAGASEKHANGVSLQNGNHLQHEYKKD